VRPHRQLRVRSDGQPGSAEQIDRKGMGSVAMREHRDCFAYVLRNKQTFTTEQSKFNNVTRSGTSKLPGGRKSLKVAPSDRHPRAAFFCAK